MSSSACLLIDITMMYAMTFYDMQVDIVPILFKYILIVLM